MSLQEQNHQSEPSNGAAAIGMADNLTEEQAAKLNELERNIKKIEATRTLDEGKKAQAGQSSPVNGLNATIAGGMTAAGAILTRIVKNQLEHRRLSDLGKASDIAGEYGKYVDDAAKHLEMIQGALKEYGEQDGLIAQLANQLQQHAQAAHELEAFTNARALFKAAYNGITKYLNEGEFHAQGNPQAAIKSFIEKLERVWSPYLQENLGEGVDNPNYNETVSKAFTNLKQSLEEKPTMDNLKTWAKDVGNWFSTEQTTHNTAFEVEEGALNGLLKNLEKQIIEQTEGMQGFIINRPGQSMAIGGGILLAATATALYIMHSRGKASTIENAEARIAKHDAVLNELYGKRDELANPDGFQAKELNKQIKGAENATLEAMGLGNTPGISAPGLN